MWLNGSPPTQIRPPLIRSSVMSRRRMVVLPEPLGPIRVTRSPALMSRFSPLRTTLSPNFLTTSSKRISGPPEAWSAIPGDSFSSDCCITSLQTADDHCGGHAHQQEGRADQGERLEGPEVLAAQAVGHAEHLRHEIGRAHV